MDLLKDIVTVHGKGYVVEVGKCPKCEKQFKDIVEFQKHYKKCNLVLIDYDFLNNQIREIDKVKRFHQRQAQYYEIKEELLRKKLKELIKEGDEK